MSNLDELTSDIINLYNNRDTPILIVSRLPDGSEDQLRCKFSGNVVQLAGLVSSAVFLFADTIRKELGVPIDEAIEMAMDSIQDQISVASAKEDLNG